MILPFRPLDHIHWPEIQGTGEQPCSSVSSLDPPLHVAFGNELMMAAGVNHRSEAEPDSVRWYAVNTLPCREFRAEQQLENQGFRVFLPQCPKTIRHARKLTNVQAAFFPRYLFVELDVTVHRWRTVNGTFGVRRLVMQGDTPHPVPIGIVETIIASTDQKGLLRFEHNLKTGSEVRLVAGPFAEQLGILERLDDSGRIRVLLKIMGGTIPVQVPREYAIVA
jgi:transcription elongation factor/antiterminator RfaH